jgi:hypothetical protein
LKGCEEAGQAFGVFADVKGKTCALGAAYEGKFGKYSRGEGSFEALSKLKNIYPELTRYVSIDSEMVKDMTRAEKKVIFSDSRVPVALQDFIVRLNDKQKKTREEIAVILERGGY